MRPVTAALLGTVRRLNRHLKLDMYGIAARHPMKSSIEVTPEIIVFVGDHYAWIIPAGVQIIVKGLMELASSAITSWRKEERIDFVELRLDQPSLCCLNASINGGSLRLRRI